MALKVSLVALLCVLLHLSSCKGQEVETGCEDITVFSCLWMPTEGNAGFCHATDCTDCDSDYTKGMQSIGQLQNFTTAQAKTVLDCFEAVQNGDKGVMAEGTQCHTTYVAILGCDAGSQCAQDMATHFSQIEQHCAMLSRSDCEAASKDYIPCGNAASGVSAKLGLLAVVVAIAFMVL